ncbi:MAG: aspartate--tRNA ligase, partial [Ruminococcus sp.]
MAEYMGELRRTNYCGDFRAGHIGQEVVVCGWAAKQRDLGQLIFIDLRDRTGIVQLAFDDTTPREVFDKAFGVRSEYVLCARGKVQERSSKNPEIPTGDVEILVEELRVLSKAQTPPFEILDDCKTAEDVRLKYRYLDLRRKPLQDNIIMRSKIAKVARDYFYENGFIEIETPMLIKSTPEGARDYLVPSRIHKGSFYALPQSPQIYKQLLMLSGFDRYIQLARCFRDEDLRADRQPEFTQIDMELSFASMEEIMEINEGLFKRLFKEILGKDLKTPFEKMTYADAMNRYGSDKPDVRFGMEIKDVSDIVADCGFGVFSGAVQNGGSVRAIVAENGAKTLTRKEIDKLTEYVRGIGAKGLAFIRWVDDEPSCSFKKFLTDEEFKGIIERTGAKKGDVVLFVADKNSVVLSTLGALRLNVAKKLDIIPDEFKFVWIVDFPFFEFDEESGEWVAMHHPFTMPKEECLQY